MDKRQKMKDIQVKRDKRANEAEGKYFPRMMEATSSNFFKEIEQLEPISTI